MKATLHTDGGARGNPGPAGIGFVLQIDTDNVFAVGEYIGKTTNNQAEYTALIKGLEKAKKEGVKDIRCYLDSELVVKQLNGQYKVRHVDMIPLYEQVQKLRSAFDHITFSHILRSKNAKADKLVNEAIDKHTGKQKRSY